MKKGFFTVMAAQTISSLADNALFIATIALLTEMHAPEWLQGGLKSLFAFAYIILAAFVGAFADSLPKGRVMFYTNGIKIIGCLFMLFLGFMFPSSTIAFLVVVAYGIVGVGAAAYSPAKYGIVTELLPVDDLVKGNSWIEVLTVLSIIVGTFLGGILINDSVANWMFQHTFFGSITNKPAIFALLFITVLYLIAAVINLMIPDTHYQYPKQESNPIKLVQKFSGYVVLLWKDKVSQLALGITTLFWGAGATLQLVVLKWGQEYLGKTLSASTNLMGVASIGIVLGATLSSRVPLRKATKVIPLGIAMGLISLLMLYVKSNLGVYILLILVGGMSGFFVVPLNALIQHRGHVLLSAGHSIAVQNFNEQINVLLMTSLFSLMVYFEFTVTQIIVANSLFVSGAISLIYLLGLISQRKNKAAFDQIGEAPTHHHTTHNS